MTVMDLPAGVTPITNIKGDKGDSGTLDFVEMQTIPADEPATAEMVTDVRGTGVLIRAPRGLPGFDAVPSDSAIATLLGAPDSATGGYAAQKFARVMNVVGAGVDPTGVADSSAAIDAIFSTAQPGDAVVFPAGGVFRKNSTTVIPDGVSVRAYGARIVGDPTNSVFVMGHGSTYEGGEIELAWRASGDGDRAHIRFGDYPTGAGCYQGRVSDVALIGGHMDSNGIAVFGDSSGITIERIYAPDNAFLGRVVMVHWGNTSAPITPSPTNLTTHPRNLVIRDIRAEHMTSDSANSCVVFVSGASDVNVSQVFAKRASGGVTIGAGDYGMLYAAPEVRAAGMRNIVVDGVSVDVASGTLLGISGFAYLATSEDAKMTVTARDVEAQSAQYGVRISRTARILLANLRMGNVTNHGVEIGSASRNTHIEDVTVEQAGWCGIAVVGATGSEPVGTTIVRARISNAGVLNDAVTYRNAAVAIRAARATTVRDSVLGAETAETQKYGIYQDVNSANDSFDYNTIRGASVTGLFTTGSFSSEIRDVGNRYLNCASNRNNSSTRTRLIGATQISSGSAVPGPGAVWDTGAIRFNSAPAPGAPFAWICTASGDPGTWVPVATL